MTDEEIMARFEALEKEIAALKKRKPTADIPFLKRQEAIIPQNPESTATL
jgi:hypothetical protein